MTNFKIFFLTLILAIGGVFVSCSNSDEPDNDSIVGTWSHIVTDNSWWGKNEVGITYTFTKQKKVTCKMWVYKDSKKTMDETYNFSYTFDGKKLTLKDSNNNTTSYIVTINGNTMTMDGKTYTKQ